MSARELFSRLMAREAGEAFLVDLGTTTVTGVCAPGSGDIAASVGHVGHPVLQTLPLGFEDTNSLGSDFARTGFVFDPPTIVDSVFTDTYGVDWLMADDSAAPLNHPLEHADFLTVARHTRPAWPNIVQIPGAQVGSRPLVVADAPSSGLIETCFYLRNSWQFLSDLTDDWRVANALLDWALESVASGYEQMLAVLPAQPDVILYGDDYGYQAGMFFSDEDFRTFVRPRLRTLFARIRRATPAAICFHCCGAVKPILSDLADLGVEMLNLQSSAKGMGIDDVRRSIPADVILHGYTDLRQLGESLERGDKKSVAILTNELLESTPAIAAPVDSLSGRGAHEDSWPVEIEQAALGAAFVHALGADDIGTLRRLGPVAAVLDRAAEAAAQSTLRAPVGSPPVVVPANAGTSRSTTGSAPSPSSVLPGRN